MVSQRLTVRLEDAGNDPTVVVQVARQVFPLAPDHQESPVRVPLDAAVELGPVYRGHDARNLRRHARRGEEALEDSRLHLAIQVQIALEHRDELVAGADVGAKAFLPLARLNCPGGVCGIPCGSSFQLARLPVLVLHEATKPSAMPQAPG